MTEPIILLIALGGLGGYFVLGEMLVKGIAHFLHRSRDQREQRLIENLAPLSNGRRR